VQERSDNRDLHGTKEKGKGEMKTEQKDCNDRSKQHCHRRGIHLQDCLPM